MGAHRESAIDCSLNGKLRKIKMHSTHRFSFEWLASGVAVVLGITLAWNLPFVSGVSIVEAGPPSIEPPPAVLIDDDPGVQMRAKLDRSKQILESMLQHDFNAVSRAARELKHIAGATDWPMQKDPEFTRYLAMFKAQSDDLNRLADGMNLLGIQTTYLAMTETCIRCHDHLRDARPADRAAQTGDVRLFPARSSAGPFRQ